MRGAQRARRQQPLGIVTERDLMTRVRAKALDPTRTTVAKNHLLVMATNGNILGLFPVRDPLPREVNTRSACRSSTNR